MLAFWSPLIAHCGKWAHKKFVQKRTKRLHNHRYVVIQLWIQLYKVMYATVVKMCLSHFICEDGRLTADPAVICWESGHLSYLPIAVVGLVSYVLAVPAVWLNVTECGAAVC